MALWLDVNLDCLIFLGLLEEGRWAVGLLQQGNYVTILCCRRSNRSLTEEVWRRGRLFWDFFVPYEWADTGGK